MEGTVNKLKSMLFSNPHPVVLFVYIDIFVMFTLYLLNIEDILTIFLANLGAFSLALGIYLDLFKKKKINSKTNWE